jgi:hypothetical protein
MDPAIDVRLGGSIRGQHYSLGNRLSSLTTVQGHTYERQLQSAFNLVG